MGPCHISCLWIRPMTCNRHYVKWKTTNATGWRPPQLWSESENGETQSLKYWQQPAVHVLRYTTHTEDVVRETWLASCAQAPFGLRAVHRDVSQSAHSDPQAVPWQMPDQARPTLAESGDETPVHGAGMSSPTLSVAAGCTDVQQYTGGQMTPRSRGIPHNVPSVHLTDTLATTATALARFLLQHRQLLNNYSQFFTDNKAIISRNCKFIKQLSLAQLKKYLSLHCFLFSQEQWELVLILRNNNDPRTNINAFLADITESMPLLL